MLVIRCVKFFKEKIERKNFLLECPFKYQWNLNFEIAEHFNLLHIKRFESKAWAILILTEFETLLVNVAYTFLLGIPARRATDSARFWNTQVKPPLTLGCLQLLGFSLLGTGTGWNAFRVGVVSKIGYKVMTSWPHVGTNMIVKWC